MKSNFSLNLKCIPNQIKQPYVEMFNHLGIRTQIPFKCTKKQFQLI